MERLFVVPRSRVLGPELDGVGPEVVGIEQAASELDESGVHAEEVGGRRRDRERHDPSELAPEAPVPRGIEVRVELLRRRELRVQVGDGDTDLVSVEEAREDDEPVPLER